jgi:hypothetical protein
MREPLFALGQRSAFRLLFTVELLGVDSAAMLRVLLHPFQFMLFFGCLALGCVTHIANLTICPVSRD